AGGVPLPEVSTAPEQFPKTDVGWPPPGGLNLRALAVRRAFADRCEHRGDPAVVQAPWERLVSKAYAREVAAELSRRPAKRGSRRGPIDALAASAAGGECTTHISVVDRRPNMVSLTHTAGSPFGSVGVGPGTGVLPHH